MMRLLKICALALSGVFALGTTACNETGSGGDPIFEVSPPSLSFTNNGGIDYVTVEGGNWQATPSSAWIVVTPASGTTGEVFAVTVGATSEDRSGVITIINTENGKEKIVAITQSTGAVTGVELDKTSAKIAVGGTLTLTATVLPEIAFNKNVSWKSSNDNVASVEGGVVTGTGVGTATITVTTEEGNMTATCEVAVNEPKLYIAGKNNGAAAIWIDGEAQTVGGPFSMAYSVDVYGEDVYVAGTSEVVMFRNSATLWKNGVAQVLNDGNSQAQSVFVSEGGDVYVAGKEYVTTPEPPYGGNIPLLWINGEPQTLSTDNIASSNGYAWARDVWVSGDDIYVVGDGEIIIQETPLVLRTMAIIWKNGVAQTLVNGAYAHGVHVDGNDVYVTGISYYTGPGESDNRPALWKNGQLQTLEEKNVPVIRGRANSVFVSEGNVYVAGNEISFDANSGFMQKALFWENGTGVIYSTNANSEVMSVYVNQGDVYVVGNQGDMGPATLWKNNVIEWQGPAYSNAQSVVYK